MTLRAVARLAGVTTPSVYLHFADRDALVEAVCLRVWDELGGRMRGAAEKVRDPFTALGLSARAYAYFALEHPVQYRVLLMRRDTSPDTPPASAACFRYVVDAVSECVPAGVLRGDPRTLALGLWSAVHGCVSLLIAQPSFPWPEDLDAFIDDTVRMAGFGAALSSRVPRTALLKSAELVSELDAMGARLTASA